MVLDALIRFSLRNRLLVLLGAALWLVYGAVVVARLPVDVFPDLNRPTVTILTESGGLSPEEVELAVSRPLEQAMNGAPGVERVRSVSGVGLSVVYVEFGWSVELAVARQQVSERLVQVREELPVGSSPVMGPVSSIMGEILLVGLVSPDGAVSGPELRRLADVTLRPRLRAVSGVSQVIAIGGGVETIAVDVRPEALARRGITLDQVRTAAQEAQAATTGGFLERKSEEYLVRTLARSSDPAALADTVVARRDGVPVTLGDVADVRRGVGVMRGDAGVNAHPGVILSIQKQPGAGTIELTERVDEELAHVRASLPAGVELVPLFRQAEFIDASIGNVEEALRDGAILVTIVLVMFLLSWRTTFITLTAIPLSFVTAALVLHAFGESINTMTLGGLAVAIGELVDDAIVDVENVYRRLRENAASPTPRHVLRVVADASSEIRNSIVFSTILVVLVFVPLFAMSGIEGRLFAPLGIAYITSIVSSLFVSLTVTPALCSLLLPQASTVGGHADSWLVRRLKGADRVVLEQVLDRPRTLVAAVGLAVLVAAASVPFLGSSFLPPFNEGTATINLLARPGTSLAESNAMGTRAEALLLTTPEVKTVGRRTGRAELDEHAEGVHYTEIDVDFRAEGRDRGVVLAELRRNLALLPGVVVNVGQPIGHRLDHLLSGVRAAIAVKLYGEDLGQLRTEAAGLEEDLRGIPGLVDLQVERQVLIPQVHVRIDRERARRFGVSPGHLAEDLETALGGTRVGQVLDGLQALDVIVRYREDARNDIATLRELPIEIHDGRVVTLAQVADVSLGTGPNSILHEDGRRRIVVSANTSGRDIGSVVGDLERVLESRVFPEGMSWSIEGQFQSQREATRTIALLSLVALIGMYAVLYSHFRSHPLTLQVLVNIPLALVGAVAALWLTGSELSVATLVGFVTLCGIATRNTILMISHYLHLAEHEGMPFGRELVIRGSLERLVPVAMTALCAGIALVPLALAGGAPGKELLTPVAQVILGGLVSSTLLDMVVTPTVFLWVGAGSAAPPGPDPLAA
jgi:CzcA family heavy metal efflux pump